MDMSGDLTPKKYIKIGENSGCYLANYNSSDADEESIIVLYKENNENSGSFKFPKKSNKLN